MSTFFFTTAMPQSIKKKNQAILQIFKGFLYTAPMQTSVSSWLQMELSEKKDSRIPEFQEMLRPHLLGLKMLG